MEILVIMVLVLFGLLVHIDDRLKRIERRIEDREDGFESDDL